MKHKHFDPDTYLAGAFARRSEELSSLAIQAAKLIELRKIFRDCLPPGLAESCELANIRQDAAIVHATNSSSAAKVRQLSPRITERFQQQGWQITAMKIVVQAP